METALYPILKAENNKNPNKMYAIPLVGLLIKSVMLIPVYIVFVALGIASGILTFLNAFVVLFNGKYWRMAYDLNLGVMRYNLKTMFFMYGITDKYPGFNLSIQDNFSLDLAYPENPNRVFAIPLIGILARALLLIPFSIFQSVINQAVSIGVFLGAWFVVLSQNRYPESMFEFARDSVRLSLAQSVYFAGLSDKYPSFDISWAHKNIKIALIIISILCMVMQFTGNLAGIGKSSSSPHGDYMYNQTPSNLNNSYTY